LYSAQGLELPLQESGCRHSLLLPLSSPWLSALTHSIDPILFFFR
jgi:hypothetical protein